MKKDPTLGQHIHQRLVELGIETPFHSETELISSQAEKINVISDSFQVIMQALNLNLDDDSLKETPSRYAKMFVNEIFEGLDYANFPSCTQIENKMRADEMVIEGGIDVSSVCEHHFQNIEGQAKVAYIPGNTVLGLSKMNRIVRFFSKRPQVQERLTLQIHAALCIILQTENVAVEIRAIHHCVKARGIEDKNCWTTTRKLSGAFRNEHETRNEFLNTK
ncbi:GTP cyclohydrolase I [Cellulophaga phage phi47:1]|uniref:GTP cyclohydrolase n=1 Tax=Cellulophaga phage phiSM TaxID=756280 RepID=UPI0002B7905E|nr:GTP cyclohydrolase [Cellulophaga phage phiSM]AGF91613.1 GTP cyclohydrolase I [Cellulophaga phage phi47:1]AGO47788.1 GTP cyclohydrolase I [Cellulophaga phage phi3ST:2]AGO49296.1 GTP cyclohydrolase I [Cellulophaga phage phi38:2]AGO49376.1 GTP cyclohydrolase I [Cellulophaga phage phi3:1]AGH07806.1 GTP cyclohydrolase I [Cellulophaga phage phiSM]